MSSNIKEKKILEEMKEHRFLNNGIKEIEYFEKLLDEICENNNIDCIPELCEIMEDGANEYSTVEKIIETILIIVKKQVNGYQAGINRVIESIERMKGHGDDWAIILNTQFLFDEDLRDAYIQCAKLSNRKEDVLEILEILKEENDIKTIDFDYVINEIS